MACAFQEPVPGEKRGGWGEKAVPKVQRKIRVTAGDASNQVVLEGMDSLLSRVFLLHVGGGGTSKS